MKKMISVSVIAISMALAGCDSQELAEQDNADAAKAVASTEDGRHGTVVEFEHVPGYTYAKLNTEQGDFWFAGPSAELSEGQTVYWGQGAPMNNFTSQAMGRSFDTIYFVDAYLEQPASAVSQAGANGQPAGETGKVISATTSAGYSYLEVEAGQGNIWVAAPMSDINAGDEIEWSGASLMTNFSSKSLGRTFDEIYFAGAVKKLN